MFINVFVRFYYKRLFVIFFSFLDSHLDGGTFTVRIFSLLQ
jgi:hypothetical protein